MRSRWSPEARRDHRARSRWPSAPDSRSNRPCVARREVDAIQSARIAGMGGPTPTTTISPTSTAQPITTSAAATPQQLVHSSMQSPHPMPTCRTRCGRWASFRHEQSGSQPVHPVQHWPRRSRAQGSHAIQVRQQPEPAINMMSMSAPANGCIEDPDGFGHHCVDSGHQRHVAGEQQLPDEDRLGMEA